MVRIALALGAILVAAGNLTADDRIDAKKLIGKWEEKGEKRAFAIEFKEGGKVVMDTDSKKAEKVEGTYKLDGNKLELTIKLGDAEHKMVRTISKLTDTELTSKDEAGKEDTLTRVKSK